VWWDERREDLKRLSDGRGPVLVYDGETLNDIVFDLLCLDGVDGVLFDTAIRSCPDLITAVARLGAGFLCRTPEEWALIRAVPGGFSGDTVYLTGDGTPESGGEIPAGGVLPAVHLSWIPDGLPAGLRDREFLAVLPRPLSPGEGPCTKGRLRLLERLNARLRGLYLPWGSEFDPGPAVEKLAEWKGVTGSDGILVTGRGTGLVLDRETGTVDTCRTAENMEAFREVFPGGVLWVEPGSAFFSLAAALLVEERGLLRVLPRPGPLPAGSGDASRPETAYLRARRICQVPL
jgi:hypothetical protein